MALFKRTKGRSLIKSKKVIHDGIEFASSLEAFMYKLLKLHKVDFVYEGKTYLLTDKFTYPVECFEKLATTKSEFKDRRSVRKMEYTPDFVGVNEEWIIETKGRANEAFPLRWKFFKAMMTKLPNPPLLFKPTNQTECNEVVKILIQKGYGR